MSQTTISTNTSQPTAVNLGNVQGDVIYGLAKDFEVFRFFTIVDPHGFQKYLPLLQIATSEQAKGTWDAIARLKAVSPGKRHELKLLNISFSQKGLDALGITESLNDEFFSKGQLEDAAALGDTVDKDNRPKWKPEYLERLDGVLIGAGNTSELAESAVNEALETLKGTVKAVYQLKGNTRPGAERGHEHFGWLDGISNPAIEGLPYPDTHVIKEDRVRPGVLLVGHDGDNDHHGLKPVPRPSWAFEGSFMVFRELKQLVPEFHHFLDENPYFPEGMIIDRKLAVQLQGARFFGRWTNGVPTQLSPWTPNGDLKNLNNFVYPQEKGDAGQTACPYSAHLRKTRPRNDLDDILPVLKESSRINRKGIPYGEEVKSDEEVNHKTRLDRGLAFVCYQSNMSENGFRFIQTKWSNAPSFAPTKEIKDIGFDPIIGQTNENGGKRTTMGTQSGGSLPLPDEFVVTQGGEYFFTPSIKALHSVFCGKPYPK